MMNWYEIGHSGIAADFLEEQNRAFEAGCLRRILEFKIKPVEWPRISTKSRRNATTFITFHTRFSTRTYENIRFGIFDVYGCVQLRLVGFKSFVRMRGGIWSNIAINTKTRTRALISIGGYRTCTRTWTKTRG